MSTHIRHFIRHYVEMVLAMFAGMLLLGVPGEVLLQVLGTSSGELETDAPALFFLGMATVMTIPMVWLMRYRGHAWRPCVEMAASMFLPTFAAIAALATGVSDDVMGLMGVEHVVMLLAMLAAMLLRFDEYAGHEHHGVTA